MPAEIYDPEKITQDFLTRAQQHSVEKWDVPYGAATGEVFLAERGIGDYLYGPNRDPMLDWNNGILCTIFGYDDDIIRSLLIGAVRTGLLHTSSVYLNPITLYFKEAAAKSLAPYGDYVVLPASSGTIADSMAIRIALANVEPRDAVVRYIIPKMGYSGADFRANAMCGVEAWKGRSTPHIEGVQFIHPTFSDIPPFNQLLQVSPNDIEKWFCENVDNAGGEAPVAPIALIEGELGIGGFREIHSDWLRAFRRAIKKRGGIFIYDAVQTFPGRTGRDLWDVKRWAEDPEDYPDIFTTAKGLGNGLPIGMVGVRRELADKVDGKWFDTFAANPLAATMALEVFHRAKQDVTVTNIAQRSAELREGLEGLHQKFSDRVRGVVGAGLMSGLVVDPGKSEAVRAAAQRKHLLLALGADGTLRIAPHFDASSDSIQKGLGILHNAVQKAA